MNAIERVRRNIRVLMAHRQTTLSEVCRTAGETPRDYISALSNGNPSLAKLEKLSTILGIDITELVSPENALEHVEFCLIPKKLGG